ncbi:hypothetical protein PR202_gb25013 [Eleusine coracana subsp. coracana]|uniref:Uncharacterized protein n=1 Tax=Eleusine coracana subsp. coracana TaxID=191504 RepID=A0AAV5FN81_ELECO|nr:hypothetical protein PR202_gb25013 [Eleusine coracana subsp. coracana]
MEMQCSDDEDYAEGTAVAVAVVAAFRGGGAEHRRVETGADLGLGLGSGPWQAVLLIRQGIPDSQTTKSESPSAPGPVAGVTKRARPWRQSTTSQQPGNSRAAGRKAGLMGTKREQ